MGKIFAIGDIHGCFDKLQMLMDKIDIDFDNDTLVFLGDYIDRGPNSSEVVELKKRFPKIIFLKGNHEEMFEDFLAGIDRLKYLTNGGQQTLDSYLKKGRTFEGPPISQSHLDFFKTLRIYYETDQYIFVHAGLIENIPLESQDVRDILWIRGRFIDSDYDFGKRVIFGHTVFPEPLIQPNKIGIDTGAVYGNKLTCLELPTLIFYDA